MITYAQNRTPLPQVTDKTSIESAVSVSDFDKVPPPVSEADTRTISFVTGRHSDSSADRRSHEGIWFESLAFYLGNHDVSWFPGNGTSPGNLRSIRDPRRPHKIYSRRNKIRPKIKKLESRATSSQIDAGVRPWTSSPLDIAASMEGRAALTHFDNLFRRQHQTKRCVMYGLTTSTVFLKVYYDFNKMAPVPKFGPDGQIAGSTMAPVGELCEDIVPCFEIYPDPRARTWEECGWLIHAKVRSVEYVQEKYEDGWMVSPDTGSGPNGYVESRLASVVGDYARGMEPGQAKKSVLILEMWEKPTKRYPKGRLVTVGGGRVLRNGPWPYKKTDSFPFIPLAFEEGISTLFGANAVQDLISPQRSYNRAVSRVEEHMVTSHGKLLAPAGCTISPSSFDSATPNEVVYYEPGPGAPTHVPAPQLPPWLIDILKLNESDINDISGVHEVSNGQLPASDLPAAGIRLLQESDTTQMKDFTDNLEAFHQARAEWEIALVAQFYNEPRLVYMSQTAQEATNAPTPQTGPMGASTPGAAPGMPGTGTPNPMAPPVGMAPSPQGAGIPGSSGMGNASPAPTGVPAPLMQAMSFRALTSGGSCRVIVEPGSAAPKSKEAQSQEILEYTKLGLFGPVGDPSTAMIVLKALEFANPDQIVETMIQGRQEAMRLAAAMQPDPAKVAAIKAQADQAAQAQALQHARDMAQIQSMVKQHEEEAKHTYAMEEANQKFAHDMSLQQYVTSRPKVSIAVKAGPKGAASAEGQAGLERDDPAEMRKITTPAPAASGEKGSAPDGKRQD